MSRKEFIFQSLQEITSFSFALPDKRWNRNTKWTAILSRQYCIRLTALEENIFPVLGCVAYQIYFLPTNRQYNAVLRSQNLTLANNIQAYNCILT